jgi:hypothetical protein
LLRKIKRLRVAAARYQTDPGSFLASVRLALNGG